MKPIRVTIDPTQQRIAINGVYMTMIDAIIFELDHNFNVTNYQRVEVIKEAQIQFDATDMVSDDAYFNAFEYVDASLDNLKHSHVNAY